jgi:ribosomal protein L12E/L44/L45/RPP1/RPP2
MKSDHFQRRLAQVRTKWLFWLCALKDPDRTAKRLQDVDIEQLARELRIDLAAAWTGPATKYQQGPGSQCFAGPFTADYWRIHSREQLAALAAAWGIYVRDGASKSRIIALIESQIKTLSMPREIAPVKLAKAKPAKKAKAAR